jgi:hypothetical protein
LFVQIKEGNATSGYWKWCTNRIEDPLDNEFDCGTKTSINSTHLEYSNSLTRSIQPGEIIVGSSQYRTVSLPFVCSWPLNVFVSTSHDAVFEIQETIVVESDVSGVGNYKAKMFLFEDQTFESRLDSSPVR